MSMHDLKELIPSELKPPLNPVLITDPTGLESLDSFLTCASGAVGFDVETNITKTFFHRRLRTIQIGNRDCQFVVDLLALCDYNTDVLINTQGNYGATMTGPLRALVDTLRPHLESNRLLKVGHNLIFDYTAVKWCLGLRPWHLHDTMRCEEVIYCGAEPFQRKGFWAMDDLVARKLKFKINKEHQKSFDLVTPLTPEQIEYAALDVRLPLALLSVQKTQLEKNGLLKTAQIENDAVPAFGDLHLNGLKQDVEKWRVLLAETEEQHKKNVAALDEHFLPVVGSKNAILHDLPMLEAAWRDEEDKTKRPALKKAFEAARREVKAFEKNAAKCAGGAIINYGSPDQVLEALRKMGFTEKKLRDTNDRSLAKLSTVPVIDAIREYRTTEKILKTYGEGFIEKYTDPDTGRIHASFNQIGAETGRTSCVKPNVQNILGGSKWRSCFVSRPGYKMLTLDYNGCELRILAELSQEPVWIEAFKKGWDVHSVGAEILFPDWAAATEPGCAYAESHQKCECKGHKKLRKRVKAINFGLAYGMEAGKLAEELGITFDEAQELMDTYKGQFVVVTAYLKKSGEYATQHFCARTMAGRKRAFAQPTWERARAVAIMRAKKFKKEFNPKDEGKAYHSLLASIQREGKNTPIQGTNADIVKEAMGCGFDPDGKPYSWHLIEPVYKSALENMIHDELLIESPDDQAEACFAAVGDCMTRAGAEFVKSISMTTDGHIGDCWIKD